MFIYNQTTGEFYHDAVLLGIGYSGFGEGKNSPEHQRIKNVGPIPVGFYAIGPPKNTKSKGPHVLPLTPAKSNKMFGRTSFLIHGDSKATPGYASEGCIILSRNIRDVISNSVEKQLQVISGISDNPERVT